MCIPPRAKGRAVAQVFIAYVVPTQETDLAIHHDYLAMVPEVDLKPVQPSPSRGKRVHLHSPSLEGIHVLPGQRMATDPIEQQMDCNPLACLLEQGGLQAAADQIIVDDKELNEDDLFSFTNGFEDTLERRLSIHQ